MIKRFKCKIGEVTWNANSDNYVYSSYGIGFYVRSQFSLNGINIFGIENSLSLHTDNRRKDFLVVWSMSGLDGAAITAEAKYYANITKSRKKICLSLHHNAVFCILMV